MILIFSVVMLDDTKFTSNSQVNTHKYGLEVFRFNLSPGSELLSDERDLFFINTEPSEAEGII